MISQKDIITGKFSKDENNKIDLIKSVSEKYSKEIFKEIFKQNKIRLMKKQKQKKFLDENYPGIHEEKKSTIKLQYSAQMIINALAYGLPLREPDHKKKSKNELKPLLYDLEKELAVKNESKKLLFKVKLSAKKSHIKEIALKNLEYIPHNIYLQKLDEDNSKILVKMYVDWGFFKLDKLNLFLDTHNKMIADCWILLIDSKNHPINYFPMKHISNLIPDEEHTANSLFVGQITGLKPKEKYRYRIECYNKSDGKLFAGTPLYLLKTPFNLKEKNDPIYLNICSDLHAGRGGGFMKGKVVRKVIKGNDNLKEVYDLITANEQKITFDTGYSLSITTGDLTENGSYPEYWSDLFRCCCSLWNHMPVLTSIGNHDYYCGGYRRGNIIGGLEEDCRFWHRYINNPVSKNASLPDHWFSYDCGNAHLIFLDSNGTGWGKFELSCKSEQWYWLENDLKNWREKLESDEQTPQFCIVFLHSAIMSLGFWGRGFNFGNDEKVQSYLLSLFRKYGVNLVFFGHDHLYQRSKWLDTEYVLNGRSGGTLRRSLFWVRKNILYGKENLCSNIHTKIFTTLYIPPNLEQMSNSEKKSFNNYKQSIKNKLLAQPTVSYYFFGKKTINRKICELFDKNTQLKKRLIDELILPKLNDHIWLRAYSIEKNYPANYCEIYDMSFIKLIEPKEFDLNACEIICPSKIVK